ncbi:lysophospholipid acyltransferase family protein [Candidatus Binatia bacterium]|nr:lysophospholipid acyltransferase family protein [Candidatus Binatia bacterium]
MSATPRRHKKPLSPARQWIEYAGIRALLGALRAMPLERSSDLMAKLVGAGVLVSARLRHVGMDNLKRAFPERDERWHREVLRGSFRSLGRLAAEVAWFDDLRPGNIRERIGFTSPESEHHWRNIVRGRRQIIATGHFGNWELFAQAQGLMGHPIHIVHRPLKNARLDDLLNDLRSRAGTDVIYKHAAAREILRLLRADEMVAIPIDQHAIGTQGTPIPFFGRLAATTTAPVRLSQLTRAPLSVAVLVRRGETNQHDILVRPPIEPPPPTRSETVLRDVMTRVNLEFEEVVRQYPEQWLWMHRRWRLG